MARTVEIPDYEVHKQVVVDPASTALVIIDMQNDFVRDDGTLQVASAQSTVPAIRRLLDLARKRGMRVVFSQDTHDPGDPEFEIWPEHALRGTWGGQMIDELSPIDGELVVQKVRYDAFYGTELDHMLRLWKIRTIVLCGTVANICVHYTAASVALRWYDVVIPKDAVSAVEPCDLEFSLRQTSWLFQGRITTSAGVAVRAPRRARATPAKA
ncbi:MAG TPA: isochorismatase family cysteine hydrolase [Solirubrobacteraceae bacterium]|jgi:nicotinamidase-related amidase|nr:isochorismatase family cysteine hydrolase [Solirubrobacteraceae bacterium]